MAAKVREIRRTECQLRHDWFVYMVLKHTPGAYSIKSLYRENFNDCIQKLYDMNPSKYVDEYFDTVEEELENEIIDRIKKVGGHAQVLVYLGQDEDEDTVYKIEFTPRPDIDRFTSSDWEAWREKVGAHTIVIEMDSKRPRKR